MAQKIRVFKLARELGFDNEAMVSRIQDMGIDVRNYMSGVDADTAQRIRRSVQQERVENTVEEHIRPTVVRRRAKAGAAAPAARAAKATPAARPVKKAEAKPEKATRQGADLKEASSSAARAAAEAAFGALRVPKEQTAIEEPKPAAKAPEKRQPAAPKPEVPKLEVAEPEAVEPEAVEPEAVEPEAVEPEVAKPQVSEPVEEPEPAAEAPAEETEAAPASEQPGEVPVEAPVEAAQEREPKAVEPSVPEPTEPEKEEPRETKKKRKAKVEVAVGPATLRPASEAPVVRRRISSPPSAPSHSPRPSRGGGAASAGGRREVVNIPLPPKEDGRRVRSPGTQRKREVESRDFVQQGRFTGVGPGGRFPGGPGGRFPGGPGRKRRPAPGKKGKKTEITTPKASKRVIRIEEQIALQELAKRMGIKSTELLMTLMGMGVGTININSTLDVETAKIVASEFGYDVENVAVDEEDLLASTRAVDSEEDKSKREVRPPVVTMMGHVDHGKTSLLDAIRKSNVTSTEAGGITQHIGAYRVKAGGQTIAFIDTPGHEAFTAMRARGANVTDIVVLVTAADDGVMPQTIEAINHARAAEVPIIVAINKCDVANADADRTRRMLMEQNLLPEELGGDTIIVEVSAKTGQGVDKLLEMIALQSEIMELDANPERSAFGVVLEAYLDRGRGPVANVLVQEGTLSVGDIIVAGPAWGKIRALTDERGDKVKEAAPSTPVEVLGMSAVPGAGDKFDVVSDAKTAEKVTRQRTEKTRSTMVAASKPSLEALYEQLQGEEQVELKLIIKADVQGTVEALRESLEKQSTEKVKVAVVHASVGGITESDVLLASTCDAIIIGFNVRPAGKARGVAEEQGIEIRIYSVIYEVVDAVRQAMVGLLAPEVKEEMIGQVEVRDVFSIPKVGTIAGSYVTEGKILRNGRARLIRDAVQVWQGRVGSLRRFKDDVKEVASGFECGLSLDGFNDIKVGDVIEVFVEKEVEASLT